MTWVPTVQGDLPYLARIFQEIALRSFAPSEEEESHDVTSARHFVIASNINNGSEMRKTFFLVLDMGFECLFVSCHFREYSVITLGLA